MSPITTITIILVYFVLLIFISFLTGKNSNEESFYTGNKQSPWYVVAFGMVGSSLSGVTFISIPGTVQNESFGYMQLILGNMLGYAIIALVLVPLYYKLQLSSIYAFLGQRFGRKSQLTGATFFLISRIIGSSLRMYLVIIVLQRFVIEPLTKTTGVEIHYTVTTFISLALIWTYTFKSGIKTIVWSDIFQTFFMLFSLGFSIWLIIHSFDWSVKEAASEIASSSYSKLFFFDDFLNQKHFLKQFIGGVVIAIAMTGLDQDMMQKNLTCKSTNDAKKNMLWSSSILFVVNFLFLVLGALLYFYMDANNLSMPSRIVNSEATPASDLLFPTIAIEHLGVLAGIVFIIGLIAAAYSSADSALTALTTSFCLDFLQIDKKKDKYPKYTRTLVHVGFSFILFMMIIVFYEKNDVSAINKLFKLAGFTYGPLLGLFFFGMINKSSLPDKYIPIICLLSPVLCYVLDVFSTQLFWGYRFGFELLLVNGGVTYFGLWVLSKYAVSENLNS